MPNKAIQNAKRLRGGALGQSSRFYNILWTTSKGI